MDEISIFTSSASRAVLSQRPLAPSKLANHPSTRSGDSVLAALHRQDLFSVLPTHAGIASLLLVGDGIHSSLHWQRFLVKTYRSVSINS